MAEQILSIFDMVEKEIGLEGRIKLAKLSKITKKDAETIEDSPENLKKVKKIASELLKRDID